MERPAAWDEYETAVMEGRGDDAEAPGDDYVMSPQFQDWLVERMREEVMGEVAKAMGDVQPKMRDKA